MLIILVSVVITILNINSYGDLDASIIEKAKINKLEKKEKDVLKKSINWGFGSTLFKLIHFAEIMFISEVSRKKISH
ncbi:hypothetical protein [Polaribacter sp. KT25b]|uniref:hypothetical protein n=1 Tax=Polaribacter sp. KT25b TaxID=1855336 RepID=UPI0012FD50A8|nr:hypothetical protein [Polaribacter sp. KT25b]